MDKKSSPPNFFLEGENVITDKKSISNGFNKFFASVGPNLAANIDNGNLPTDNFKKYLGQPCEKTFKFNKVTELQLLQIAKQLKNKHSYGDDLLSNSLLKSILPLITTPLLKLINLSLETGFVPAQICLSKITPVFNEGCKNVYTNYRPISVISSIGKLFEKVVYSQLENFLSANSILTPNQFGFRRGHSVSHPLLLFNNKVFKALTNNNHVVAVLIDL